MENFHISWPTSVKTLQQSASWKIQQSFDQRNTALHKRVANETLVRKSGILLNQQTEDKSLILSILLSHSTSVYNYLGHNARKPVFEISDQVLKQIC